MNVEHLLAVHGLDFVGFMTLTFRENLTDRVEAQRRFNSLASNFLRVHLVEYVAAVERQERGALHYHLIAAFRFNLRAGFDFSLLARANAIRKASGGRSAEYRAAQAAAFATAGLELKAWWKMVRDAASKYGFGRCETLPLISNGEAVARYVGGYVVSEYWLRRLEDKGLRTLRYSLKHRVASVRWSWVGGAGGVWRKGCAALAAFLNVKEDLSSALGNQWAWQWRREIPVLGRHFDRVIHALQTTMPDGLDFEDRLAAIPRLVEMILAWEKEESAK